MTVCTSIVYAKNLLPSDLEELLQFVGKKVESNSRANDFLHVRPDDGDLDHDPEQDPWHLGVVPVAQLRQVHSRDDAQPRGQSLHQQAQERRPQQHPE